MPVTFDEDDWAHLTSRDRIAIRILAAALNEFEPLAKFAGLGQPGIENLIAKGLAEEGRSCRPSVGAYGYRLTKKGWLAFEWLTGNRMREYPDS
jgi:hypothetical protein